MFKNLLFAISLSFITFTVFSQTQFENASFEDWEEVGTPQEEPVNWSSLKTSDNSSANNFAPRVMFKSDTIAHSGEHSVYLINKYVSIISSVAVGTFTNGRYHIAPDFNPDNSSVITVVGDDKWHTQLVQRPDSVVGWYLSKPLDGDFPTVKFILHRDSASAPGTEDEWIAEAYWEGPTTEVNTWTRFSVPFEYYNDETPEFILSIITAGNGVDAKTGSQAWYDDVELIYNPDGIEDIKNGNFNVFHANGQLNVNLIENHAQIYLLQVFDLAGHIVFSQQIESGGQTQIPVSLPQGVYIVSVNESGKALSKKVFIQ